jgi:hypothetical protein
MDTKKYLVLWPCMHMTNFPASFGKLFPDDSDHRKKSGECKVELTLSMHGETSCCKEAGAGRAVIPKMAAHAHHRVMVQAVKSF